MLPFLPLNWIAGFESCNLMGIIVVVSEKKSMPSILARILRVMIDCLPV